MAETPAMCPAEMMAKARFEMRSNRYPLTWEELKQQYPVAANDAIESARAEIRALAAMDKALLAQWIDEYDENAAIPDDEWEEITMFRYLAERAASEGEAK